MQWAWPLVYYVNRSKVTVWKGSSQESSGHCLCLNREFVSWNHPCSPFKLRERERSGGSGELSEGTDNVMSIFRPLPHQNYSSAQVSFPCSLKERIGRNSNLVKLFFQSWSESKVTFSHSCPYLLGYIWSHWEYLLHFKFISCPNKNEPLSDEPKDTMRMGQVWGNALRCWIKWHIFWNAAKHPISFKDETEAAPGIIQHWSKCVVVWNEDLKSGKQKMKKRKLFLESDFWRRKQLSRGRNSLSRKAWSCRSSTCKAKMLAGT